MTACTAPRRHNEEAAGKGKRGRDGGADEASSHAVLMGRAQFPAKWRRGRGKQGRGEDEGGKEKEGADLPLPFAQAPGKFLN